MLKISSILSVVATVAVIVAANPGRAETNAAYAQRFGWGSYGPFQPPGADASNGPDALNRESGPDRYLSVLPLSQITEQAGAHQKPRQAP